MFVQYWEQGMIEDIDDPSSSSIVEEKADSIPSSTVATGLSSLKGTGNKRKKQNPAFLLDAIPSFSSTHAMTRGQLAAQKEAPGAGAGSLPPKEVGPNKAIVDAGNDSSISGEQTGDTPAVAPSVITAKGTAELQKEARALRFAIQNTPMTGKKGVTPPKGVGVTDSSSAGNLQDIEEGEEKEEEALVEDENQES